MSRAALPRESKRQRWRATLATFAVLAASQAAAQPDLSWIDRAATAAGEIIVNADRGERPLTVLVRIAAEVDAAPAAIWKILTACELAPEYIPNVVSCKKVEELDGGRADLFVQTIKPIFFLPTFEHVFRLDYTPYTRIDVHRVSGPIAHMEGSWWLVPQDDGRILLVYEVAVDPGLPIPRFLVRATMRRDLPKIVEAVRERAEAASP
jgi:polyketide cyclase/dehydrase/lipid transport protein